MAAFHPLLPFPTDVANGSFVGMGCHRHRLNWSAAGASWSHKNYANSLSPIVGATLHREPPEPPALRYGKIARLRRGCGKSRGETQFFGANSRDLRQHVDYL